MQLTTFKKQNLIMSQDHSYRADFKYKHQNPYHDRLSEFSDFVFRDNEAEHLKSKWSSQYFKNDKPIHVEIGCGYGHFMQQYCLDKPEYNFVGIDYRFKRSFSLAKKLTSLPHEEKNFCLLRAKGERVGHIFGEKEVDRVFYFFPDPWPKTRHHKKRLFQAPFLKEVKKILRPGGEVFIKTDHDDYAEWMRGVIRNQAEFDCVLDSKDIRSSHPAHFLSKYTTKFEKIFIDQGIKTKAFIIRLR